MPVLIEINATRKNDFYFSSLHCFNHLTNLIQFEGIKCVLHNAKLEENIARKLLVIQFFYNFFHLKINRLIADLETKAMNF